VTETWRPTSSSQEAPGNPGLQRGTGLRDAQIGIWIRIAGRTMNRVLFRRRTWMKRERPS